jgi:hypothetical protein
LPVAYHVDFWVAAATVAPVLAVAHSVLLTQLFSRGNRYITEFTEQLDVILNLFTEAIDAPRPEQVQRIVSARKRFADLGVDPVDVVFRKARWARNWAVAVGVVFGLALNVVAIGFAMHSLSVDHDYVPTSVVEVLIAASFVALGGLTVVAALDAQPRNTESVALLARTEVFAQTAKAFLERTKQDASATPPES